MMSRGTKWVRAAGALLALGGAALVWPRPAAAPAPRTETVTPRPERNESLGRLAIPEDLVLVNQRGQPVNVYRELVKGRVVAVSFIFTRCTTICPPLGVGFSRLQELLGERAGKDVSLITVSLDPVNDTPERLAEWGKRYRAGPGWTLLGGSKAEVDRLLKALAVYTPAKEQHAPLVLVGNDATGEWVRAYGLAAPQRVLGLIDRLARGDLARAEGTP